MAKRKWTDGQRVGQSELMTDYAPWRLTKGPVTTQGKKQSKKNSLIHGYHCEILRELLHITQSSFNHPNCKGFIGMTFTVNRE